MIMPQGGLTLPEIPAYGHVAKSIAINVFAAAAAVLERESRAAESGAAYLTGGLMHAGSVALNEAAIRLPDSAPPHEEPEWVSNALKVLSDLGMRFPKCREVFESYAAVLRSFTVVPKPSPYCNRMNICRYRDTIPLWGHYPRRRGEPRRDAEPVTPDGDVILSRNDLALLQGLYDRPDCTVASCSDWVHAAYLHRAVLRGYWSWSTLRKAVSKVHPAWVIRKKIGSRIQVTLSARGRAIVEREVRACVRGRPGIYNGMRWIRERQ